MKGFIFTPKDPPNEGILFVDHQRNGRSGHLGHALVAYAPGKLLAFYPNCSSDNHGHSGYGWMEYKRSLDGGLTWSTPEVLAHSKQVFEAGGRSALCEKAVCTDRGTIVLFALTCDMETGGAIWEPYLEPAYLRSFNGGETWTQARTFLPIRGRVYDALYRDGVIYVLFFANDATEHYTGRNAEQTYQLYVSRDDGESFSLASVLPFDTTGRCYGSMEFLADGRLIAYVYDIHDEAYPDYVLSADRGCTWAAPQKAYLAKKIRNPQLVCFEGAFFLHGRSGNSGDNAGHFVIYGSPDGIHWDEGQYLRTQEHGAGCYSNNLVVPPMSSVGKKRLLIQSSHAYKEHRTNVLHWWVEAE